MTSCPISIVTFVMDDVISGPATSIAGSKGEKKTKGQFTLNESEFMQIHYVAGSFGISLVIKLGEGVERFWH